MHDTAFHIGSLAMNIYADLRADSILEIGSQSVNGSLRDNALPTTHYVGLDIQDGDGVDIVVEPSKPFPVDDNSFDLVIASSVFEHDPFFWVTFLEMCRATKDGGYIYINAPSNGLVHRYPQDNWRFYPDSGRALAQWAVSQGLAVTLVESFIAKREQDIWNDFVAVFRKGRITKTLPKVFIHEHVPCTDVITWKSKDILNPSEQTEDLVLLTQAAAKAQAAENEITRLVHERESLDREAVELKTRLAATEGERQLRVSEAAEIRGELNLRESELRQRQEEIEQTRGDLTRARSGIDDLRGELFDLQKECELRSSENFRLDELRRELENRLDAQGQLNASTLEQLREREAELAATRADSEEVSKRLTIAERDLKSAKERLGRSSRKIEELVASLRAAQSTNSELEKRLIAHFHETATLSQIILEAQESMAQQSETTKRIRELYDAVMSQPRWWAILSHSRRSRLQAARLYRLGVFDAQSYLGKNPDVAAAGEDPLHHYIHHGIEERRPT